MRKYVLKEYVKWKQSYCAALVRNNSKPRDKISKLGLLFPGKISVNAAAGADSPTNAHNLKRR